MKNVISVSYKETGTVAFVVTCKKYAEINVDELAQNGIY